MLIHHNLPMSQFSWRTRRDSLEKFANEIFDVLIIGGGITGAGIALDAVVRGLRVGLVEKRDFAAGTSSRSTKLIHGGLRYLEHFDFALVREGLHERAILSRIAPHLAEPFPFVIPIYQNPQRNYDHPIKMRAGLALYDLLAGRHNLGRHRRLSQDEALQLAPQLDPQGLRGAFLYYDALTNDSRLVIEIIKGAHDRGACIANYTRVNGYSRNGEGKIVGAHLHDEMTDSRIETRARVVINATGVWIDETLNLGARVSRSSDAYHSQGLVRMTPVLPGGKQLRPSKGIHLTVSRQRLRVNSAWLIPSLSDHRFYFIVPWEGRVNIGTTDRDYADGKDSPHAESHEVQEILSAINSYFPSARLELSDVISSWAGLRPLIGDPNAKNTRDVSRREELFETTDGLISISGGKLTTYRRMAERTMDLAAMRLNERFGIKAKDSRTTKVVISGGEMTRQELAKAALHLVESEKLTRETAEHLIYTYGSNFQQVISLLREDERLREHLIDGLPQLSAEVVYAARHEMALTLADLLARRTRLAILAGNDSLKCAPLAADLMARELNWTEQEKKLQIEQLTKEIESEYLISGSGENAKHAK